MESQIIHIEDDLFFAKTFQKELEKYGLSVGHYENCSDVLIKDFDQEPDIIFIDHLLDNELGANEIPKFKQKFQTAKIILLTSVKDLSLMDFAFSNGVDKYLLKNKDLKNHLKSLFS